MLDRKKTDKNQQSNSTRFLKDNRMTHKMTRPFVTESTVDVLVYSCSCGSFKIIFIATSLHFSTFTRNSEVV